MICLEPLGTGVLLPAFLVGYELGPGTNYEQLEACLPAEGPIVVVDQQAGGYCMRYPTLGGCLLRLEANEASGRRPLAELVRGLKAMAEDPDFKTLEAYPVLQGLVCTAGEPYTRVQLEALREYLSEFLIVPPVESGLEALVRFGRCDPLDFVGGWAALTCRPAAAPASPQPYSGIPGLHYEQTNLRDLVLKDDAVLDGALTEMVAEVGRRLGVTGPPRLFLLWENSD